MVESHCCSWKPVLSRTSQVYQSSGVLIGPQRGACPCRHGADTLRFISFSVSFLTWAWPWQHIHFVKHNASSFNPSQCMSALPRAEPVAKSKPISLVPSHFSFSAGVDPSPTLVQCYLQFMSSCLCYLSLSRAQKVHFHAIWYLHLLGSITQL